MVEFCKSIVKKFSPILSRRKSGDRFRGYFLVNSGLHMVNLPNSNSRGTTLETFNRWLIIFRNNPMGNHSCGPCAICSCSRSYFQKGEALVCMTCGNIIE